MLLLNAHLISAHDSHILHYHILFFIAVASSYKSYNTVNIYMSVSGLKNHSFLLLRNATLFQQLTDHTDHMVPIHISDLVHLPPLRIKVVVHVVGGEGLRSHP